MEGRPAPVGGAETGIRDGVYLAGTAPGPLPAPGCPQQPSERPPRGRTASASEAAAAAYPWVAADPLLSPWLPEIAERDEQHAQLLSNICALEGSLDAFCFASGLQRFGLQRGLCGTWYREWAPAALAASLVGDFNGWDPRAHPCGRTADGVFEVFVPDAPDGGPGMPCGSRYKVRIKLGGQGGQGTDGTDGGGGPASGGGVRGADEAGVWEDRVPAWAMQTAQDTGSGDFVAVVPADLLAYRWRHAPLHGHSDVLAVAQPPPTALACGHPLPWPVGTHGPGL